MANGRSAGRAKGDSGRDSGGFVALPWSVLDSAAYAGLSHPARALLFELARQFVGDNNGRLLASRAYLAKRGWKSADVIARAKHQLLETGFLAETVKGHRPNKASWFAVTWRVLDRHPGYDAGAVASFERGAYRSVAQPEIERLSPSRGQETQLIAPSPGQTGLHPVPLPGAVAGVWHVPAIPPPGHHLDMPSAVQSRARGKSHERRQHDPAKPNR